jgi:hypothetical protein
MDACPEENRDQKGGDFNTRLMPEPRTLAVCGGFRL